MYEDDRVLQPLQLLSLSSAVALSAVFRDQQVLRKSVLHGLQVVHQAREEYHPLACRIPINKARK